MPGLMPARAAGVENKESSISGPFRMINALAVVVVT
jgi:hypothetical protein